MTEYGYRGPTIDHSLLSPSGRMSKRARDAALKREGERLFAGLERTPEPTEGEKREAERTRLLRQAAELRRMAAGGMHPRKYPRIAAQLEAQAAELA